MIRVARRPDFGTSVRAGYGALAVDFVLDCSAHRVDRIKVHISTIRRRSFDLDIEPGS